MKKVIISLLLVMVLSLALAAPALADPGGVPNENADWGQAVSDAAPRGDHASEDTRGPDQNMAGGRPWRGAHNNIRDDHGY